MRKLPLLENWYTVQLSKLVICGQVYGKKGVPKGFTYYTGEIYALQGPLAVCQDGIYNLGSPDKVWIKGDAVDELDKYEI